MKTRLLTTALLFAAVIRLSAQIEVVSGGNVGVGTASPDNSKLHVSGGAINLDDGQPIAWGGGTARPAILGNKTSGYLLFYTVGSERMRLDNTGNVGIGTTTPWSGLHVVGAASEPTLTLQSKALQSWNWPSGSELDLTISNASPYTISFQTRYTLGSGTTYPLALNPLGGNIGIGTKNPSAPLHVKSFIAPTSGGQTVLVLEANPAGANAGPRIDFTDGATVLAKIREVYDSGQGALAFHTYYLGDGERMRISALGNVGIGTTAPAYKLEVAGSVRATSFISNTTTYADFVFDPGYKLPSLSEVEAHIKELGHLPGIPSEAEAREHGIDLAAMQVKLLQKIEELTLHQIAQEKRLQALETENTRLRSLPLR